MMQIADDLGSRTLGSEQPETWGLFRTKECIKDYLNYLYGIVALEEVM